MIKQSLAVACCLGSMFFTGCGGGGDDTGVFNDASLEQGMVQKSVTINQELNGYQKDATLASNFEKKRSQKLSDILFIYLLDNQEYFPSIAYETYKQLSLGSLTQDEFDEKFVLDFVTYTQNENDNLVVMMMQKLKENSLILTPSTTLQNMSALQAASNVIAIPSDLLSNKTYNVFSETTEFTLSINSAVSKASAKSGFFTVDLNLQLQDNYLYSSSSQGDLKMWLEYPPRQDDAGNTCLCVHAQEISGKDLGLSYYFTQKLNIKNLDDADTKCKSYPELVSADSRVCTQELSYLKNPVTGVCTEFTNSCDAADSGWSESCSLETDDTNTTNDTTAVIVIGDVSAQEINDAVLEAYAVALESKTLSIELLTLAREYEQLADILIQSMQNGVFVYSLVPQLSQNSVLGESFLRLMKANEKVSQFVFDNLDEQSYVALMRSLMFSREASLLFSEILVQNPSYLEEGSALYSLIFSVNDEHGELIDNANEMLFTAMFSSSAAVKNMLDAVDALGSELKGAYLDFIFLGEINGVEVSSTQKYYNLSAIAEGMVVGMKAESGEDLFSLSYTTKLVGYFLTSISPSKYLAYGKALYSAGTDYLSKVDMNNLTLFKGAMTNPVVQLETNTTLEDGSTSNASDELYGVQYDSQTQSLKASLDTEIDDEQVNSLSDYTINKKATGDSNTSGFFTFIPSVLNQGSEIVPKADEDVMDLGVNTQTNNGFFFLAPVGQTPDIGTEVTQVDTLLVQSTTQTYNIFKLKDGASTQVSVDKTKDIHMIVVPW